MAGDLGGERRQFGSPPVRRSASSTGHASAGPRSRAQPVQQAVGGGARLVGHPRAGQHPGDLLAPAVGIEHLDGGAGAVGERALAIRQW